MQERFVKIKVKCALKTRKEINQTLDKKSRKYLDKKVCKRRRIKLG